MVSKHDDPAESRFLDIFRYLLILVATGYAVFLIWKQNRVLAFLEAFPVFIVVSNLFGFLTLPLYRRPTGLLRRMSVSLEPFSLKHLLSALDAFSLHECRKPVNPVSNELSRGSDPDSEIVADETGRDSSGSDRHEAVLPDVKNAQPAFPCKERLMQQMSQLISLATKAIYSEQFSELDALVQWLPGNKSGRDLLRAYLSIRIAAQLNEPPRDADIETAIEQIPPEGNDPDNEDFAALLDLYREQAEIQWLRRQKEILRGKRACQDDKYSYEATIYALQRHGKGPMTREDREKFKELAREIADLKRQIQEYERESMERSDREGYQGTPEHLKIQALQDELYARKEHRRATEVQGLTEVME